MKTSAVLASALLSAFAAAAPVDKRALVYHTEIVTETVVIYTTVYDDDYVPEATSTSEGLFYEQSAATTNSSVVVPTSSAAVSKIQEPSEIYTPAPETTTPAPVVTPTPAPEQSTEEPKPTTTETPYVAPSPAPVATTPVVESPAPAPTSAAPAPASTGGASTGESFTNVDITIYDNDGSFGACGTALHDTDMIVALAQPAWGASTYDVMTGAATNPWCGQKIQVEYNGNSIEATIMDLCPGCVGHDIDLSLAAWKALTGLDEKTRLKASWSKMS